MKNKLFYNWRVIYPSGEKYYRKEIKLKDLITPFRFELIPLVNNLKQFNVDIKNGEKLVYFRRVKGHFGINNNTDDSIDYINYCIGKKVGNHTSVTWISAETGKIWTQSGENIKL